LHGLLSTHPLPAADLALLIDAREIELQGPMDTDRFGAWVDGRFGALTRLAVHLLAGENPAARQAATAVGHAMGVAFTLRRAVPLAAEANLYLMPGLAPSGRTELARGRTSAQARDIANRLAEQALARLAEARVRRGNVPKAAVPALLPVWRAERVLKQALRPGFGLQDNPAGRGGRAMALAWRALLGRW
jgi:phytoene synthase